MKKLSFALAISAIALIRSVSAQSPPPGAADHLLCYSMKTPALRTTETVDMLALLQPEFTQKGCGLLQPAEFCVPAAKTNVSPAPANPDITGQPLDTDYICYVANCPGQPLPADKRLSDQFHTRLAKKFRPVKVCVPARKAPVGCGLVGKLTCGGICPNPADDCRLVNPSVPSQGCTCTPANCGGSIDTRRACGGLCPTGEVCRPNVDNVCACQPPPPPLCGINAAGVCGGACSNPDQRCVTDSTGACACESPCAPDANGVCGGACPDPTAHCVQVPGATGCTCQPQGCGKNPLTGQCSGDCPTASDQCRLDDTTGNCTCQPPPCSGNTATGACGGNCPTAGDQCVFDTTRNSCTCATPCGQIPGTVQCGGGCPVGQTCLGGAAVPCACGVPTQ